MAQKSIRKNYLFNAVYQVLLILVPLITAPYLSRVLEPDGVGTVSYVESVVSYFVLFATMGITTYGQREISYVQEDRRRRSIAFWNTKILGVCSAMIALTLYIVFAMVQDNSSIYMALSLNIIAVLIDITWFFQGMEEFGKIVIRNIVLKCLHIAYIFLLIRQKSDLPLYVFGLGLFTALGNLSMWVYLPRYVEKVPLRELQPFKDLKVVWSLFVPTIAIQIYTVLDKTMIGLITQNSFENGYYEQAIKIAKMLLAIVTALGTVMVPRIGYYFGQKNHAEIKRLMYRGYRFVWFLGVPLCLGLIAVAGNFVPWFLGKGYEEVIPLLRILSFLLLAIGISNVTGTQYFIPTKRQKWFTLTVLTGAGVNFSLNMLLIYFFQSFGAAIASVAAEAVVSIVQLILVRKELSPMQIVREGKNYYLAGLVMLFMLWLEDRMLTPSPIHTACMVLSGATVYFAILLIERDEFFLSNMRKVCMKVTYNGNKR